MVEIYKGEQAVAASATSLLQPEVSSHYRGSGTTVAPFLHTDPPLEYSS